MNRISTTKVKFKTFAQNFIYFEYKILLDLPDFIFFDGHME